MKPKTQRDGITASILNILVVLATASVIMVFLILLLSETPGQTLKYFFTGPFSNKYYLGNLINNAVPLVFTGIGISIAFRSSMFNLGGEGQVYCGGFAASLFCLYFPFLPGWIGIVLSLLTAALIGGAIAGMSGIFKTKWGTDELLSSFLISRALIHIIDSFITGYFKDPESNLNTTEKIAQQFRLFKIFQPSSLNLSLFLALAAAGIGVYYLFRTRSGYKIRMIGLNEQFARYGGIDIPRYKVLSMIISGALHGMAGAGVILGTHYMCLKGFSSGLGWNGIVVALIGAKNPAGVIPAALFFSFIASGAESAMINSDITLEIAAVVQSVVFFLITSKVIYNKMRFRRRHV